MPKVPRVNWNNVRQLLRYALARAQDDRIPQVAGSLTFTSILSIVPLLNGRGITMIEIASADELGRAVGRAATAVVGVLDAKLARGMRAAHRGQGETG